MKLTFHNQMRELRLEIERILPHQTMALKEVGARWSSRTGWTCPPFATFVYGLIEALPNLEVDDTVTHWLWEQENRQNGNGHYVVKPEILPASNELLSNLRDYQIQAIRFLVENEHSGAMLNLSPRLGKTVCALTAAQQRKANNVLIIAPLSLLGVWEDEAQKWLGRELTRHHLTAPAPRTEAGEPGWCVTNYDTVVSRLASWIRHAWDVCILDESILVKSRTTQRFKALKILRPHCRRWWELSGFPISRYADDLWAQLHLINSEAFTSYWKFTNRFCFTEQSVWGTKVIGTREDKDLRKNFVDVIFTRSMQEVAPELPKLIPQTIRVNLVAPQRKAYDTLRDELVAELPDGSIVEVDNVFAKLTRLQQITSNLRTLGQLDVSAKGDAIDDLVESKAIEIPLLCWVHWIPTAHAVFARLCRHYGRDKVGLVLGEGGEGPSKNEATINAYRSGALDALVLSITVGRYGLNLSNTNTVIYHDHIFEADAMIQSSFRTQHLELKKAAGVIHLHARKTTDDLIALNLEGKIKGIESLTGAQLKALLT